MRWPRQYEPIGAVAVVLMLGATAIAIAVNAWEAVMDWDLLWTVLRATTSIGFWLGMLIGFFTAFVLTSEARMSRWGSHRKGSVLTLSPDIHLEGWVWDRFLEEHGIDPLQPLEHGVLRGKELFVAGRRVVIKGNTSRTITVQFQE